MYWVFRAKLSRKNCSDSNLFKQLGRSDSGGTTVYYSYSIFSYIYWYIPNWYIFISVKKELVYIPTRYRPSGHTFALGPPCGPPAVALRSPCRHLASALILWLPQERPKVTVRHQIKDHTASPRFRSPQFINTPCGSPKNKNM